MVVIAINRAGSVRQKKNITSSGLQELPYGGKLLSTYKNSENEGKLYYLTVEPSRVNLAKLFLLQ